MCADVAPASASPPKLNPVRVPIREEGVPDRTRDFREVIHAYSRAEAVLEAKRCIQCRRPWCVEACPISQDAREYIRRIAAEDFDGAAKVTLRDDPLASTLCKVCYHYCEDACVVGKRGVPVAIRHLKRAALEHGSTGLVYVASKPRAQRVAVVGAGPAGLMAAWDLAVRGYPVTVYEQEPQAGGLVRTIPAYRMTEDDLGADLDRFRALDVTFVLGTKVGKDVAPEALLREGFAAVFVSIGTPAHRILGVPGEDLPGVIPALGFLRKANEGSPPKVGKELVVIGGGDVAMDSVRTALRLSGGGRVTLVYRRSREEMPADAEEFEGAQHEGIRFLFLRAPIRILGRTHVEGLVVQTMELGPPDAGGRRSPVPVPGSETTIPCDTVLVAVGQKADTTGFGPEWGLRISSKGWPEGAGPAYRSALPGVFAAGGQSVVYAMGAAMEAVVAIDAYLAEKRGEAPNPRPDPFGENGSFHLPAGYTKPIRV